MSKKDIVTEQRAFDALIDVIGVEIEQAQVRLIAAANVQLLLHYWRVGHIILNYQQKYGWGGKIIDTVSKMIRVKFPEKKGYSPRNLRYMCQFSRQYNAVFMQQLAEKEGDNRCISVDNILTVVNSLNAIEFRQEPPAQLEKGKKHVDSNDEVDVSLILEEFRQELPAQLNEQFTTSVIASINWASHMILMDSKLPLGQRYWYMKQALENGWSSNVLDMQVKSDLFGRQIKEGKVNNFTATLPKIQSDLANYLLKDPYIFDLAGAREAVDERDIEEQLVTHITKYLLQMGTGFAFVARQKHFQVGDSDFYADLVLYNIKLHAYVVIELKATPFKPEYAGQLNFYINVIDDKLRGENDNKTIGLLLCKGKDEVVAQYALTGYNQPIGVSDYQLSKAIPEDLKSTLPSVEDVEQELTHLLERDVK